MEWLGKIFKKEEKKPNVPQKAEKRIRYGSLKIKYTTRKWPSYTLLKFYKYKCNVQRNHGTNILAIFMIKPANFDRGNMSCGSTGSKGMTREAIKNKIGVILFLWLALFISIGVRDDIKI